MIAKLNCHLSKLSIFIYAGASTTQSRSLLMQSVSGCRQDSGPDTKYMMMGKTTSKENDWVWHRPITYSLITHIGSTNKVEISHIFSIDFVNGTLSTAKITKQDLDCLLLLLGTSTWMEKREDTKVNINCIKSWSAVCIISTIIYCYWPGIFLQENCSDISAGSVKGIVWLFVCILGFFPRNIS